MRKYIAAAAATVMVLGAAACGTAPPRSASGDASVKPETRLAGAFYACPPQPAVKLDNSGYAMIIDTKNKGGTTGLVCVLVALDTPEYLLSQIDSTTALMGRQTVEADGLTYSWSYHPDNGLNMTIVEE